MAIGNFNFDLRQFREDRLHLTQKELAGLLGLRQDNISRMEQNPEQMTITMLVRLAMLSGQSLDEVVNYKPIQPKGLDVRRTWAAVQYNNANIRQLLQQEYGNPDSLLIPAHRDIVEGLQRLMDILTRKPVMVVAGGYNSGKSTFINSLLGQPILPTDAETAISSRVRIRHIGDRPDQMKSTVYQIKELSNFDVEGLKDASYRKKCVLMEGGLELLAADEDNPWIQEILVYADSSILLNCDIVRLPSPSFSDHSSASALSNLPVDMLVYLVSEGGAAQRRSASYFRLLLERMRILESAGRSEFGCLSNLFVVCSKAHLLGSKERARCAAQETGYSLYSALPTSFWEGRKEATGIPFTKEDFLSRCFFYAVYDDPSWREPLEEALCTVVERIPRAVQEEISRCAQVYRDAACQMLPQLPAPLVLASAEGPLPWSTMSEPEWRAAADLRKDRVADVIKRYNLETVEAFQQSIDKAMDEAFARGSQWSSAEVLLRQQIANLQVQIERILGETLRIQSAAFSEVIEDYLSLFSGSFDARACFFRSLEEVVVGETGYSSIGALVYWLAQQDAWALAMVPGLFIPANRISVSFLSGISADGMETEAISQAAISNALMDRLTSAMLNSAGPISSVLDAASRTTSDKKAAKITENTFRKEISGCYSWCIPRFWYDTGTAFIQAAEKMQEAWLSTSDAAWSAAPEAEYPPEQRIREAQDLKDFLESLPL